MTRKMGSLYDILGGGGSREGGSEGDFTPRAALIDAAALIRIPKFRDIVTIEKLLGRSRFLRTGKRSAGSSPKLPNPLYILTLTPSGMPFFSPPLGIDNMVIEG